MKSSLEDIRDLIAQKPLTVGEFCKILDKVIVEIDILHEKIDKIEEKPSENIKSDIINAQTKEIVELKEHIRILSYKNAEISAALRSIYTIPTDDINSLHKCKAPYGNIIHCEESNDNDLYIRIRGQLFVVDICPFCSYTIK